MCADPHLHRIEEWGKEDSGRNQNEISEKMECGWKVYADVNIATSNLLMCVCVEMYVDINIAPEHCAKYLYICTDKVCFVTHAR